MSGGSASWKDSFDEREQDLVVLLGRRMNDAVYTKEVLFSMSDNYEDYERYLNVGAVIAAGSALGGGVLEWFPVPALILLSIVAAALSFVSTSADFDRRAIQTQRAAEAYNRMYQRYQAYYYLVLKDDERPFKGKRDRLQRLIDRHEELNSNTMSTDSDVMEEMSTEEIFSRLDSTPDELDRLLNDDMIASDFESTKDD